jgi:hypothetical protein
MKKSMKKLMQLCIAHAMLTNGVMANAQHDLAPVLSLQGKNYDHDISFYGSFLYYYAAQDGLDLGNSAELSSGGVVIAPTTSVGLMQSLTFNPAFKVGMGVSCDNWMLNADYTWIRQTTFTNTNAPAAESTNYTGVWTLNNWFQQTSTLGQTISATHIDSSWELGIDFADLTVSAPFYENQHAALLPFFGLRGAWIRQNLDIAIQIPDNALNDIVTNPVSSNNLSRSWAVGPRAGCNASWNLGHGLRFTGSAGVNALFTQYTDITHSEQVAESDTETLNVVLENINCLRPELDLSFGLAWSTYCQDERCYFDISASYDFLVLGQQNMMRKLVDQTISGTSAAPGDLFLQGLNAKISLYF